MATVLSTRALNRALLARQHLLERSAMSPVAMVEHLVGMQAQNPRDPYFALWSRVRGFEPAALERLHHDRSVVRIPTLRTTIHLHSAADAGPIALATASVREKTLRSTAFGRATADIDRQALLRLAEEAYAEGHHTSAELGARLRRHWPEIDASSLAYTVHYLLQIVQPPPRGLWTKTARPTWTTLGPTSFGATWVRLVRRPSPMPGSGPGSRGSARCSSASGRSC
jgi:hypothetical protein